MGNRIKELRQQRNLSAKALGERLNSGRSTIVKLERGEMNLTTTWMDRIAGELNCSPIDLLDGDSNGTIFGRSVSMTTAIASAFSEGRPDSFDLPRPQQRIQAPPRLKAPDECFAATVEDDSADRLYPAGSVLFCRGLAALDGALRIGNKVVVRAFTGQRSEHNTMEVLVGILDRTLTGELVVLTRSTNPRVPSSVVIQHPPATPGHLSERFLPPVANVEPHVDYAPEDADPAEIMGLIVMAMTPE